jgi:flagellar assembly protein FliH
MSAKIFRPEASGLTTFPWQESSRSLSAPATGSAVRTPGGLVIPGSAHPTVGTDHRSASAPPASNTMLEQARQEAALARAAVESKTKEAYQQGFDEGFAKASQQQRAAIEAAHAELAESLSSLSRARQLVLSQTDVDLVHVAMAIAEKVLNRQLQIDQDALRGVARAALERLAGKPVLAIRAHPQDQEALARAMPELEAKAIRWLPDDGLARGSIQFETEFGVLDASIHTQLEEIEHGLVDHLQRSNR